jgi:hypothetical protein
MPVCHQIERGVVVIFGLLAVIGFGHAGKIPSGDWILTCGAGLYFRADALTLSV